MSVHVEVAVSEHISSTERGRLLEQLGREILESRDFDVESEVRLTGIEVDLLARNRLTSECVYVECKAHRDPLPADAISKLLGNVDLRSASAGWLITTGQLGKDAKGVKDEWEQRLPEHRRRLSFYTPDRLVQALIRVSRVCDPACLQYPEGRLFSDDKYLLVTNHGRFWAVPLVQADAGVPYAVTLFDVRRGAAITDPAVVSAVAETDTSLAELDWLSLGVRCGPFDSSNIASEAQNIVMVSAGDRWADYRPARPQDFVGRMNVQNEVFQLLDSVRTGTSSTRLFALKSPSGWGKSSVLLKLADRCRNRRNRGKYFMYPVDARTATSSRYGELALVACLRAAAQTGFMPAPAEPIRLAGAPEPLSDSTLATLLAALRAEQKVVVLAFDQFEEIFAKKELAPLFDSIRTLCAAIDSAQENVMLGFAWKTDGTIPQDHPAYYMWHDLADKRREFSLTPFSAGDTAEALSRFARELGTPLNPLLKRHLADHCQGYPWLLKKLCIHVYDLVRSGADQNSILDRGLSVKELFEKDRSELAPAEDACLRRIAQDSPAEFFQVADSFGGDTIQALINRRLVLRSGSRLTLYWDIFRDYVLTNTVPQIPVTYIPQYNFRRYCDSLRILLQAGPTQIRSIASRLNIGEGSAENTARDLVMVGNAQRQADRLCLRQPNEAEAVRTLRVYLGSHILLRHLLRERGPGFTVTTDEIRAILPSLYPDANYTDTTWRAYANRLLGWFSGAGILVHRSGAFIHSADQAVLKLPTTSSNRRLESSFVAQAPPDRVLDVIRLIGAKPRTSSELVSMGHRNSVQVLYALGGATKDGTMVVLEPMPPNPRGWLAQRVGGLPVITAAQRCLLSRPGASGDEIGLAAEAEMGASWTPGSKRRYGNGLRRWVEWLTESP